MYFNVQTARKPGLRTTSQPRLSTYFLSQNAGRVIIPILSHLSCLSRGVHYNSQICLSGTVTVIPK
jgi:hypothetical protein